MEFIKRLSFFFVFILNINLTTASGIGVSPDKLIFDKNNLEKEITIFNLNSYDVDYIIDIKNNKNILHFSEKDFTIGGNSSKKIKVKLDNLNDNFYEDVIYVRQSSENGNLLPGVGVKVVISKEKVFYDGKGVFVGSVILLIVILVYIKYFRKV